MPVYEHLFSVIPMNAIGIEHLQVDLQNSISPLFIWTCWELWSTSRTGGYFPYPGMIWYNDTMDQQKNCKSSIASSIFLHATQTIRQISLFFCKKINNKQVIFGQKKQLKNSRAKNVASAASAISSSSPVTDDETMWNHRSLIYILPDIHIKDILTLIMPPKTRPGVLWHWESQVPTPTPPTPTLQSMTRRWYSSSSKHNRFAQAAKERWKLSTPQMWNFFKLKGLSGYPPKKSRNVTWKSDHFQKEKEDV